MADIKPLDVIGANYNAVKIQINDPKTSIPQDFKSSPDDLGTYNAVNLEVNNPTVDVKKDPVYNYPEAKEIVTFDMAGIQPAVLPNGMPAIPVAYQTNLINNRTLVNADFDIEIKEPKKGVKHNKAAKVPEPNVTTPEHEKNLTFHGLSFKAEPVHQVEIVPPEDIKPDIDIPKVCENLASGDYDVQALQIAEIFNAAGKDVQKAVPYVVTDVFTGLIDIVKKDVSTLTPPSDEQNELRRKFIINRMIQQQAEDEGLDVDKIELPYKLTEDEQKAAVTLTNLELAERNKEYAIKTIALLAKVYTDESERHTGNVIPLTDLPGISAIVDTLRYSKNSATKLAAIVALNYIQRPEYNEELKSVFMLTAKDDNPYVAATAAAAIESLEE